MKHTLPIMIIISLVLCACSDKPKKPPIPDLKEEAEKLLDCTPDMPLSKGELYERAMVDFLQKETDFAWEADYHIWDYQQEKPEYERKEFDGDEVAKLCGLTYDWLGRPKAITKDRCYPYQIKKYDEYHDLVYENKGHSFESFIASSQAKVYRPNIDPPIYKAENYNKDVNFVVVHNRGYRDFYPKDCCKLISYDEAQSRKAYIRSFYHMPENQSKQLNVLMIKTWIFSHKENERLIPEDLYRFYAISPCGKILP